jgi:hypothetical protein
MTPPLRPEAALVMALRAVEEETRALHAPRSRRDDMPTTQLLALVPEAARAVLLDFMPLPWTEGFDAGYAKGHAEGEAEGRRAAFEEMKKHADEMRETWDNCYADKHADAANYFSRWANDQRALAAREGGGANNAVPGTDDRRRPDVTEAGSSTRSLKGEDGVSEPAASTGGAGTDSPCGGGETRAEEPPAGAPDRPLSVALLRSQYDGKTLAVDVCGIRHGPDLGPWEVVWTRPLDDRISREIAMLAARAVRDWCAGYIESRAEQISITDDAQLAAIVEAALEGKP